MRHHASRREGGEKGGELPETPLRGMEFVKQKGCVLHTHSLSCFC